MRSLNACWSLYFHRKKLTSTNKYFISITVGYKDNNVCAITHMNICKEKRNIAKYIGFTKYCTLMKLKAVLYVWYCVEYINKYKRRKRFRLICEKIFLTKNFFFYVYSWRPMFDICLVFKTIFWKDLTRCLIYQNTHIFSYHCIALHCYVLCFCDCDMWCHFIDIDVELLRFFYVYSNLIFCTWYCFLLKVSQSILPIQ